MSEIVVIEREELASVVAQAVREALVGLSPFRGDSPHADLAVKTYLTEAEAALYCELAESTFRTRRSRGKGPDYIKDGSRVIYNREALDAYLSARTVKIHGR